MCFYLYILNFLKCFFFFVYFSDTNFFKPDKPHKKYLETLIRKNGGSVHSFLNVIPRSCYKFSYLITDTPSQTCNFYLCLSLGIPSYHHKHVENAVSQVSND